MVGAARGVIWDIRGMHRAGGLRSAASDPLGTGGIERGAATHRRSRGGHRSIPSNVALQRAVAALGSQGLTVSSLPGPSGTVEATKSGAVQPDWAGARS